MSAAVVLAAAAVAFVAGIGWSLAAIAADADRRLATLRDHHADRRLRLLADDAPEPPFADRCAAAGRHVPGCPFSPEPEAEKWMV